MTNYDVMTGRFLNVFREDDRVTKAILELVKPIAEGPEAALVQALFFARWCNRDTTLKANHICMWCSFTWGTFVLYASKQ